MIDAYNQDREQHQQPQMPEEEEDIFKLANQNDYGQPQPIYDHPINVQHDLMPPSSHQESKNNLPPSSHLAEPKSRNSLGNAGQNIISNDHRQRQYEEYKERKRQTKEAIPREQGYIAQRQETNYVRQNQRNIVNEHSRPAPLSTEEKNAIVQKPKNYGKVPAYIDKFNKEREDEKVRRHLAEEQAKLPPGTRLMPEDERIQTLEDLMLAKK